MSALASAGALTARGSNWLSHSPAADRLLLRTTEEEAPDEGAEMSTQTVAETPLDDTVTRSRTAHPASSRLPDMTLISEPELSAPAVSVCRHPLAPTDEQIAAKKSRRRLSDVQYAARRTPREDGERSYVARYFNADGFDAYGYDARGNYDATQRTTDAPCPFPHH